MHDEHLLNTNSFESQKSMLDHVEDEPKQRDNVNGNSLEGRKVNSNDLQIAISFRSRQTDYMCHTQNSCNRKNILFHIMFCDLQLSKVDISQAR